MNDLAHRAATLLNGQLRHASHLSGGDLSEALLIELKSGERAIVKNGPSPRLEATMLQHLRTAGAPTPNILAVSDDALILAILPNDGALNRSWADMARILHKLSSSIAPLPEDMSEDIPYGWPENYAFGKLNIQNTPHANWVEFWVNNRLIPHLPFLPATYRHHFENIIRRASDLIPDHPHPTLLHGDLWGGNILCNEGKITGLIDPASYYGHDEVDIAMLTLFDHPAQIFWSAFANRDSDFMARLSFYKLWPCLVHFRLFGSSYLSLIDYSLQETGLL